jgi:hypothetical protein
VGRAPSPAAFDLDFDLDFDFDFDLDFDLDLDLDFALNVSRPRIPNSPSTSKAAGVGARPALG